MRGVARAPGTCGELVQGTVNGVNFLVTCPVDRYSVVEVTLQPGCRQIKAKATNRKVEEAVARTLAFFGADNYSAAVRVDSSLPVGKGMASSTADITAACVAAAQALKKQISSDDIAGIALAIEPTDGIMYPGLVLFDHVAGRMCRSLGMPPEIKILIVDPGGMVDTEQFNARDNLPELNRQKEHTVCQALKLTEEGLGAGNPRKIGRAATLSALANQHIIFKPELAEIIKIADSHRALGVNTAHSGTVIGILYDESQTDVESLKDVLAATNKEFQLTECILIGGGAEIPAPESGGMTWVPYNTYMAETSGQRR